MNDNILIFKNIDSLSDKNKVLILGDMFELGNDAKTEHQHIVEYAESLNFDILILIGKNYDSG